VRGTGIATIPPCGLLLDSGLNIKPRGDLMKGDLFRTSSRGTAHAITLLLLLGTVLPGADECGGAVDMDGDGFAATTDCDDEDAAVYPGADEVCDGADNDCDGEMDEGLDTSTWYPDQDGDGFGDETHPSDTCGAPEGHVSTPGDCDDDDGAVYPGAEEWCDGQDDDCDGQTDDACVPPTLHVPGDAATIQAAIDRIAHEGVIEVGPGTWEEPLRIDGKDITLTSLEGPEQTVLAGPDEAPLLTVSGAQFRLSGFQLAGSWGYEGPGIDMVDSNGAIEDCLLEMRNVEAGIHAQNTSLELTRVSMSLLAHGLALKASGSVLMMDDCDLYAHSADDGWTVVLEASKASVAESRFTGYGIHVTAGSEVSISDCSISDVSDNPGVAVTDASTVSLVHTSITELDCYAVTDAGVHATDSTVLLDGCSIERSHEAGGIYLSRSILEMRNTVIADNDAEEGAGIRASESSLHIERSVVCDNRAHASAGGGILAENSSLDLVDSVVCGNWNYWDAVFGAGGGIYLQSSTARITGSRISDNLGGQGGGIHARSSDLTVERSDLSGNSAETGGAVHVVDGSVTIRHSFILENEAWGHVSAADGDLLGPALGGGLYLSGTTATIDQSVIAGNVCDAESDPTYPGHGGGVYETASTTTIHNTILAFNNPANLYDEEGLGTETVVTYSDLHVTSGMNHNLPDLDPSNLTVDPGFLGQGSSTSRYHLSLASPLIDTGDPAVSDLDGSRSDMGPFGGPGGGEIDLDTDGYPDYFWPGLFDDVPAGVDPAPYDRDDGDSDVH